MGYKDIKGFEGEYQIDTEGNTYSCKFGKRKLLKPIKHTDGYLKVHLCKDGKQKRFYVHRLVAMAFIHNPYNLPEVNHKNEDKTDNRVENLEWCDRKYNVNYGARNDKVAEKCSKPVNQFTKDGILIAQYPSAKEAERQTGYSNGNISKCCRGKYFDKKRNKWVNITQHNGFIWRYAE